MTTSHARLELSQFKEIAPHAYAGLITLGEAAANAGLDKGLLELIKIRASQINGCAYCLQHHITLARKLGVPSVKLDLVAAWRDAGVFSPRECAALGWTESLTRLDGGEVPDAAYSAVRAEFSLEETAFLTSAVAVINAWNRIAIPFRSTPAGIG